MYRPDLGILYLASLDTGSGQLEHLGLVPIRMETFRLRMASPDDLEWFEQTLTRECLSLGTRVVAESERTSDRWLETRDSPLLVHVGDPFLILVLKTRAISGQSLVPGCPLLQQ